MNPISHPVQTQLIRWSEWHAVLMLVVIDLAWAKQPLVLAAGLAALSFALLLLLCRNAWTPTRAFGAANAITLLRTLATLTLVAFPSLGTVITISLALVVLLLDGLDGWIARQSGMCSEFGEYFDKETDAFFMLALCLILFRDGHLGAWVLLLGGFRYVFVLFLKFAQPPQLKESATRFGKFIGVFVLGVLLFCLLPVPQLCTPLAVLATLALIYSFALSLKQIYTRP